VSKATARRNREISGEDDSEQVIDRRFDGFFQFFRWLIFSM